MRNMNIFERLFLVALWPYARLVEYVGDAIDRIDWGSDD